MKSLQVLEEQNNQGRKNWIKFVEKAGRTVRNVVARNYPWRFEKCNSEECFQCTTCNSPKISQSLVISADQKELLLNTRVRPQSQLSQGERNI